MSEADYYPPGAYRDPNAPYNQHENDEHEFNIVISQSLSKETTVLSKDYIEEFDEEGGYYSDDTSEINWSKEYDEQHYTPLQLIERFKKLLNEPDVRNILGKETDILIKECEGWTEDETLVEEN